MLGVGHVYVNPKTNVAYFYVSNRSDLNNVIIPKFDNNPLLTIKYFDFINFKTALSIIDNPTISRTAKYEQVAMLKAQPLSEGNISPA